MVHPCDPVLFAGLWLQACTFDLHPDILTFDVPDIWLEMCAEGCLRELISTDALKLPSKSGLVPVYQTSRETRPPIMYIDLSGLTWLDLR